LRLDFGKEKRNRLLKVLLTSQDISAGIDQLAAEITAHYAEKDLTIIGVMTGSIILLSDLIRRLDRRMRVGLIQARSYQGENTTAGHLQVNADMLPEVEGTHVLLLDDIFDSGQTLSELVNRFQKLGATSVRTAVLLRKDRPRDVTLTADHVVFDIGNHFVVGYGLDYNDEYRNLPHIAILPTQDFPS